MKNIHILPTDKPSRLHFDNKLFLSPRHQLSNSINSIVEGKNIYITSDEEIKAGEKGWLLENNSITKNVCEFDCSNGLGGIYSTDKKIILTTDQDLIKDGVQAIDDTFLEWFIKNPSFERVEVKQELGFCINCEWNYDSCPNTKECLKGKYKIIIPKEPKPIHQQIIDIVGGEDRFREIANLKPKQETLKKVEENIDREEWIHFFRTNSKEEILEYLIKYKFPL